MRYIREKVDELLKVIGTSPLRPEELDDETLIGLDPIGIVAGSFRQVLAHLNRTNAQLQLAREELQAIFDCAGLGILVIDRDQRILACNAKFREQFATGDADLVGRSCREVVCKTDRPDRPCPFMHTLQTGEAFRCPDWLVGGRHYDIVETAIRNQEGEVTGSVLVYSDISERIAAEEALRRSEARYRDIFENTSDLILSARPDGSLEYVNNAWCVTLGYSQEEAQRLNLLDLLHPACDAGCRTRLQALLRGEGGGQVRTVLTAKDGRMVVLEGDVSLVREHGEIGRLPRHPEGRHGAREPRGGSAQARKTRIRRAARGRDRPRLQQHPHRRARQHQPGAGGRRPAGPRSRPSGRGREGHAGRPAA